MWNNIPKQHSEFGPCVLCLNGKKNPYLQYILRMCHLTQNRHFNEEDYTLVTYR